RVRRDEDEISRFIRRDGGDGRIPECERGRVEATLYTNEASSGNDPSGLHVCSGGGALEARPPVRRVHRPVALEISGGAGSGRAPLPAGPRPAAKVHA